MNLLKYLQLLTELKCPCLNKLTSKYGKRIVLSFFFMLYKAWRMSESSFSHSFLAVFLKLVIQLITSFILKQVFLGENCFASLVFFNQVSFLLLLYANIPFKWLKTGLKRKLFDFYVESIAFRIKILINVTSVK